MLCLTETEMQFTSNCDGFVQIKTGAFPLIEPDG